MVCGKEAVTPCREMGKKRGRNKGEVKKEVGSKKAEEHLRSKNSCASCDRVFATGQALGGHRSKCPAAAPQKVVKKVAQNLAQKASKMPEEVLAPTMQHCEVERCAFMTISVSALASHIYANHRGYQSRASSAGKRKADRAPQPIGGEDSDDLDVEIYERDEDSDEVVVVGVRKPGEKKAKKEEVQKKEGKSAPSSALSSAPSLALSSASSSAPSSARPSVPSVTVPARSIPRTVCTLADMDSAKWMGLRVFCPSFPQHIGEVVKINKKRVLVLLDGDRYDMKMEEVRVWEKQTGGEEEEKEEEKEVELEVEVEVVKVVKKKKGEGRPTKASTGKQFATKKELAKKEAAKKKPPPPQPAAPLEQQMFSPSGFKLSEWLAGEEKRNQVSKKVRPVAFWEDSSSAKGVEKKVDRGYGKQFTYSDDVHISKKEFGKRSGNPKIKGDKSKTGSSAKSYN